MKKMTEELLQEQGLERESIYDFLYPGRRGVKGNTFVGQNLSQLQYLQNDEKIGVKKNDNRATGG